MRTAPSRIRPRTQAAPSVPTRRDRRKLATRQTLLDAAHSLLASRSLDALSVDEIVMRADVAKGTFYNYFPDKEALARELTSHMRMRLDNEIARTNDGIDDPVHRIARAFCCVLRLCLSAPEQAAAMLTLFPRAIDPAAPINAGVRRDVADGLAQERIVAPSEDVAIAFIVGVVMAGATRALDLSAERTREFAQALGAMLLQGLGLGRMQAARIIREAVESILT